VQDITITPVDDTAIGTFTIVAVFTPTNGVAYTYNALTFSVTCTVTSFTDPSISDISYTIFNAASTYQVPAAGFVQVPTCGYAFTVAYTWTGFPASGFISEPSAGSGGIFVKSEAHSDAGTHAINYDATFTLAANGATGGSLSIAQTGPSFNVIATDPCLTTTLDSVTVNDLNNSNNVVTSTTIVDGTTQTSQFQLATLTHDLGTAKSNQAICNAFSVAVYTDNDGTDTAPSNNWVYITQSGANYLIDIDTTRDLNLLTTESTVSFNIYVKVSLDDYTDRVSYTLFTVTVTQVACDCQYLLWSDPTTTTATVTVGSTDTVNVPKPVESTSQRSTITAFDNCYVLSTPCSVDGSYAAGSITLSATDADTLAWASFTSTGAVDVTTQTIDFTPTKTEIGTHTFAVVFTPDSGSAITWNWVVTVTCTVTSFAQPAAPTTGLTYNIYDAATVFDYTGATWVQSPDCGYTYSNSFAWEGDYTGGAILTNPGIMNLKSEDRSDADGTHNVKLANTITIASNGPAGSTTFTPATDADKVLWTFDVLDPCATTTIDTISVTPVVIVDGQSTTFTFTDPGNSVMTTYSLTDAICGTVTHAITADNLGTAMSTNWVTLSGPVAGVYTVTIDTTVDLSLIANEASVSYTHYIQTTLTAYTSQKTYSAIAI
jgi:hypothetical protein